MLNLGAEALKAENREVDVRVGGGPSGPGPETVETRLHLDALTSLRSGPRLSSLPMETLRKRIPFTNAGDDDLPEDESRVLDEQEQEELIDEFRKADTQSRQLNGALARVVIVLSAVLHLLYLFGITHTDPITSLDLFSAPSRPLPLSTPFAILHLLIHSALAQRFLPPRVTRLNFLRSLVGHDLAAWLPPSYRALAATATAAPLLSLVTGCGPSTTLWWCVPGAIVGLAFIVERGDAESEGRIRELEKLQYVAKGA